ncbi:MAG: CoA transferase [Sulfuricaulis sp.]|nr:CoA transferase [Sulfuricaulis sp.]
MAERPVLPPHQARPAGAATALAGLRVIDFSHFVAGPYCTLILGDFGADVLKIENPVVGDNIRLHRPPALGGEGAAYLWTNRNKRGLALDVSLPAGRDIALALIDQADVLVENFSTGVMDRLGLGYAELSARNPRLIYCSISAAGRDGAMAQRMGFDPIAQAESGFMAINGHPDSDGVVAGAPIMDITTGMMASNAILAALAARERLGQGQYIEIAMFDQAAQLVSYRAIGYLATGIEPPRVGNMGRANTPVGVYPTATGPIYLCCANERTYRRLALDVFGRADLADGPEYANLAARLANFDGFNDIVRAILATNTRDHWIDKMRAAGVPVGAVATIAEAFSGADMRERGLLSEIPHPTAGTVPNVAPPYRLSLTPVVDPVAAPTLGQHTREVLHSLLKLDDAALAELALSGALGEPARGAAQAVQT